MAQELMSLLEDWKGYVSPSEVIRPPDYEQRLTETINLLSNARGLSPHRWEYELREALTTADFPYLFGDILDRQVLASYKAVDPVWKAFTKMSTNKDFKTSRRFAITGGDDVLARVVEKGEYLASDREEAYYDLSVLKYGRQFDISWETIINDDLGALKDTPERFARAAIRTEHNLVTNRYAGDATLYQSARGAVGYNNASGLNLTIANLETAVEVMTGFLDAAGNPIMNRAKYLVVPPALEMTARQILTSANKMWLSDTDPAAATPYPMTNTISQYGLQLIVDPYLAIHGTNAASRLSQWYLFADPKDIAALEFAHLKGHERPEICMKASDKVTVGGGSINPMSGDFATDNIFYRVRLVCGVTRLDWRATYCGGDGNL